MKKKKTTTDSRASRMPPAFWVLGFGGWVWCFEVWGLGFVGFQGVGFRFRVSISVEGLECAVRRVHGVGCWGLGLEVVGM